ncbi:ribosome biogenesis GTP-binding protein YihA/YsxC [Tepidamorphus sp. 3E244]|uniref:ribosome biogenesis GTP-binding protein YihA/YsxC n=1 Tax=Tepidamorphus sp. 3E244 TaxID=3385498 RepID=UPI0038FC19DD
MDDADDAGENAEAAEAAEAARKLFAGPIDFMLGVAGMPQLPSTDIPEVAFAGRSNVGKSTLINAVTGRKQLARTSGTPGRTREINFFDVGGRIRIVDLPGHGYASAPKAVVQAWTGLIHDYLRGRVNLARVFLLIDARHGIKKADEPVMETLDKAAVSWQAVLTKCDKLKKGELARRIEETKAAAAKHPAAFPALIATSSETGAGITELREAIHTLALDPA